MPYEVYLHNVPKVSEDGMQAIPVPPSQKKVFDDLEEAQRFAAEQKDQFERVMLMRNDDEGQKLIERYMDGKHEKAEDVVRR